jgi:hypothetical protein
MASYIPVTTDDIVDFIDYMVGMVYAILTSAFFWVPVILTSFGMTVYPILFSKTTQDASKTRPQKGMATQQEGTSDPHLDHTQIG